MGKFFKILGVIFLVLIVLIVVGLFFAHDKGDEKMQELYSAIASNNPQQVLNMCTPELKSTIDPPVLELWMKGFNQALGKYQGLSNSDFNVNYQSNDGKSTLDLKGTVEFEKGQAKTVVNMIDGKIAFLKINSDQFKDDDWLTEPQNDFYKTKAIKFLSLLTDQPVKAKQAIEMLPAPLKKQLTVAGLTTSMNRFAGLYGTRKNIEQIQSKFVKRDANGARSLTLYFKYHGQKKSCDAYVKFVFGGLGSEIYGFLIPSAPVNDITALFKAVESGNPEKLMGLCDPRLKDEFDMPVLKQWMQAFNKTMGKFKGIDTNNFNTDQQSINDNSIMSLNGNVMFAKGPGTLQAKYLNDKIISFLISSKQMDKTKWFKDVDMSFCKEKGKKFLTYLVQDDPKKAQAMMLPKLRKRITAAQIKQGMKLFAEKYGLPKSINVIDMDVKIGDNTKAIKINYEYIGKISNCKAYVVFVINGLKTEVTGFKIPV